MVIGATFAVVKRKAGFLFAMNECNDLLSYKLTLFVGKIGLLEKARVHTK